MASISPILGPRAKEFLSFSFMRSHYRAPCGNRRSRTFSKNYRVIAIDLRGHGESDASLWHFTLDDYAEDIHALLTHMSIKQATFIGLSMGGYTLFALYRKYPELVKAMVLADTRAQADSEEAKAGRFAMVQTAYRNGPQAIADMMMPKLLAPSTIEHRKDIVDRIQNIILKQSGFRHYCRPHGHGSTSRFHHTPLSNFLSDVDHRRRARRCDSTGRSSVHEGPNSRLKAGNHSPSRTHVKPGTVRRI